MKKSLFLCIFFGTVFYLSTALAVSSSVSAGYTFTGELPNGLVNGQKVFYTTTASYRNGVLTITFDGGADFEWVWLFAPDHNRMRVKSASVWSREFAGFVEGQSVTWTFTVRKNHSEANNVGYAHTWVIKNDGEVPSLPENNEVSLPTPWSVVTVGADCGTSLVTSSGITDYYSLEGAIGHYDLVNISKDNFTFPQRVQSGDFLDRLSAFTNDDNYKGYTMVRESLDPESRFIAARTYTLTFPDLYNPTRIRYEQRYDILVREVTGGVIKQLNGSGYSSWENTGVSLVLVRKGDNFSIYNNSTGQFTTSVATVILPLHKEVFLGKAMFTENPRAVWGKMSFSLK
ncbi:MAG: hypothetical protein HQK53_03365 [Oligoflexia bacterium]|nr:hypothetical protein [Oligoflexia bacterium]